MINQAPVTTERRAYNRFKSSTLVRLSGKNIKSKFCKAINLSAEGAAVQTNNVGLIKNQQVELMFIVNLGKVSKLHRRIARVCHVHGGVTGFALMRYEEKKPG